MSPWTVSMPVRKLQFAIVVGLAFCVLPILAHAQPLPPGGGRSTVVDCAAGQKIGPRLTASRVALIIKGTCTENVVGAVDDVSITTDGVTPATIVPADPSQPTIQFEGSRRVVIDGRVINGAPGLTVNGGTFGIVARRGANVDVKNCLVTNTTSTGVIASYGSSLVVDNCTITGNAGNGAAAVNTSSLVITNSVVSSNTLTGIVASRSSYIRVGQDAGGTAVVRPVTVSGNGTNGVVITEGSAGNVVGGTIETSGSTNLFIGRASSGQIGVGSNFSNAAAGVTIQNGSRDGVSVEGANATIVFSTISGNARVGILVSNGGSARIGILNGSTGYGPTTVSANGNSGILVSQASAWIGGTAIRGNGTVGGILNRFGVQVHQSKATLVGDNIVENNGETGVFTTGGEVTIGDAGFGLTTTNTISGNGGTGPNRGGVFAFLGGVIRVLDGTITNNTGPAVQAFDGGIVELRGTTAVTVPAGVATGALVEFSSTLRVRDTASIVNATGDGIQTNNLSGINIRDNTSTVQGNGAGAVGIRCTFAATLAGNLAGVSGNAGATTGCNVFP